MCTWHAGKYWIRDRKVISLTEKSGGLQMGMRGKVEGIITLNRWKTDKTNDNWYDYVDKRLSIN